MCAATFRRLQHGFSTRGFALQVTPSQGLRRQCTHIWVALRVHACICLRLGFLAVVCRLHVRLPYSGSTSGLRLPFCGSTLSSRLSPCGGISTLCLSLPSPSPVDGISILGSLFYEDTSTLAMRSLFAVAPLVCARLSAAARVRACLHTATSRVRAWPHLAPRTLTP